MVVRHREYDVSYNIDTWINIKISKLTIPLVNLAEYEIDCDTEYDKCQVDLMTEGKNILGYIKDDSFLVSLTDLTGSWSGNAVNELEEILKHSTGYLDVICIWEGGDSITRLISDNGKVSHEELDIVELVKENSRLKQELELCK